MNRKMKPYKLDTDFQVNQHPPLITASGKDELKKDILVYKDHESEDTYQCIKHRDESQQKRQQKKLKIRAVNT